ncbi:CTD nuclear envelope phosphatase 1 [Tanacetum coccineum]
MPTHEGFITVIEYILVPIVRALLGKHLGGGHGKGSETVTGIPLLGHVVLDLDETLVCAYETSSMPDSVRKQATDAGLTWFELECVSSYRVRTISFIKRPSKFADLVLFTAGLEGYARPLVDRIDAENRFSRRLYRPSTISTEYQEHVKDLSFVSTDFCRMVIVDNNPFSFLLQPVNRIPCIPFSAGQPRDDQDLPIRKIPQLLTEQNLSKQSKLSSSLEEVPQIGRAEAKWKHLNKQVLVEELKEKSINEEEILDIVEEEGIHG